MADARSVRVSLRVSWLLLFANLLSLFDVIASDLSLSVSESAPLQFSPRETVQNSPGAKRLASVKCERVQIHGLSRIKGLKKFAHSVKVKVSCTNSSFLTSSIGVCFHKNESRGIGMCPQTQWEKLTKGLWIQSMSPFDHKLLDIRVVGSSIENIDVSIEEEFHMHRIAFLVIGIFMWALAPSLSKSLVFFYSSAMTIGIILVILMILFQGMRLLPTGRKKSLGVYMVASIAGLGSCLLHYLPSLFNSVLMDLGISKDMYYPLAILLLVFTCLVGAWLGFWIVHKYVTEADGSINISTSTFVAWAIRLVGATMILQATVDHWLAIEALVCGILLSDFLRKLFPFRFLRQLRSLFKGSKKRHSRRHIPPQGLTQKTPSPQSSGSGTYYSSFHSTPERRKFSKDEWVKFTRDSTKDALEGLVSSPDFSTWAAVNAERLTLRPESGSSDTTRPRRRWFLWF